MPPNEVNKKLLAVLWVHLQFTPLN